MRCLKPPFGLPANEATKPDIGPTYLLSTSGEFQRSLSCRAPDTTEWILDAPEYTTWHYDIARSVLNIHGPSGTGKSVLAASIVDHLQRAEPDVPSFQYFCPQEPLKYSTQNQSQQSLSSSLLISWLAQAFEWSSDLKGKVDVLEEKHRPSRREKWSWNSLRSVALNKLWDLLVDTIKDLPKIYCVIDGVDAFQDPEDADFLQQILGLQEACVGNMKLILTSRNAAVLENTINVSMVNENVLQDVRAFVDGQLESFQVSKDIKSLIKNKLMGRSFIYTHLALLILKSESDPVAIHQSLVGLSPNLYGLYDHILKAGTSGPLPLQDYRRTVLTLVIYAGRRLRRLEITRALEVQFGPEAKDQELIKSSFGPLLKFLADDTFSLIHESFIEFIHDKNRSLESQAILPIISAANAHENLSSICFRTLIGDHFNGKRLDNLEVMPHKLWRTATKCMPFLDYAASNWFLHARELSEITGDFKSLLLEGMRERRDCIAVWMKEVCRPSDDSLSSFGLIHVAGWSGSVSMIGLAMEQGSSCDTTMSDGTSALAIAAQHGHYEVVKFLLENGASSDPINRDGKSPLDYAASHNHVQIVLLLVQAGALVNWVPNSELNMKPRDGRIERRKSAFSQAFFSNAMEVAEQLILLVTNEREIDDALDHAASYGKTDWVKLLLTSPLANVNGRSSDTPLFRAGLDHHLETMKLLLRRGADPNKGSVGLRSHGCVMVPHSPDDAPSFPLHAIAGFQTGGESSWGTADAARLQRARECCQVLIDAGANVNAQGLRGNTSLHISASKNLSSVVELLLENGADPSILNDEGKTTLCMIKASKESIPLMETLIKCGLKLDEAHEVSGKVPFHSILESRGPSEQSNASWLSPFVRNWNAQDRDGNILLHHKMAPRYRSNAELIAELMKLGADPRRKNNLGEGPMHILAKNWSSFSVEDAQAIFRLFLDAGVDMGASDVEGRIPLLHLVAGMQDGHNADQIPNFIREFGANVKAVDNDLNGVLHLFLQGEPSESVFFELLELGADPLLVNAAGENTMHILMRSKSAKKAAIPIKIIKWLSRDGVSSTYQDQHGNTPLHVLCLTDLRLIPGKGPDSPALDVLLDLDDRKAIHMRNNQGLLPIHLAGAKKEVLLMKLISKGASSTIQTDRRQNLLHIAASACKANNVGFLLDHYRELEYLDTFLNQEDENGCTPLHAACKAISQESVSVLMEAGASLDIQDHLGQTPLVLSRQLLEDILKSGPKSNTPSQKGPLFLHTGDKRAGQLMEIICLLEQALGHSPSFRGDHALDLNVPFFRLKIQYEIALNKGDYGAFKKSINAGADFGPVTQKQTEDLLSMLIHGRYSFLFSIIAHSLQDPSWVKGSKIVSPYLAIAAREDAPNMPILRLLVEKFGADVNATYKSPNSWEKWEKGILHILATGQYWWQKWAMEYLLARGANPDMKDSNGRTPLHVAIKCSQNGSFMSKYMIQALLKNGADPNQTDKNGIAPLDMKISDSEISHLLVQHEGKPSRPDRSAALLAAIGREDMREIQEILATGQDCNVLPPEKQKESGTHKKGLFSSEVPRLYPLERALMFHEVSDPQKHIPIIKVLLEHGADPLQIKNQYQQDEGEVTILHSVIQSGHHIEVYDYFLGREGIDLESQDPQGNTLFLAACKHRKSGLRAAAPGEKMRCMDMYERGANIRAVNKHGENVLHCLMARDIDGYSEAVKRETLSFFARECPELVNQRNEKGFTPFHLTPRRQREWAWEILLEAGADPLTTPPDGVTALHKAVVIYSNWFKWFSKLHTMGIDVNSQDQNGETPIFWWARTAQVILDEENQDPRHRKSEAEIEQAVQDTIQYFKKVGCDFHLVNKRGENLLHIVALRDLAWESRWNSSVAVLNLAVFKTFVGNGLDPLDQNEQGWSALDAAISKGNENLGEWYGKMRK
ncbi:Ankyrin repeat-containing protein [Penicillium macrosclerotiorum]|uniref:Ankyrin repeat-containing protein n=1 Tax=Penicillium macrosclerotiorum TaxID=303699 RepID=UPI00254978FA|nr:Ankyrin repeat-containing protein [Penicillium macrosclerotiorum]KAJ5669013.1 Ankyrin repeat-containing protein [Penicillium macrosclerotiorum]